MYVDNSDKSTNAEKKEKANPLIPLETNEGEISQTQRHIFQHNQIRRRNSRFSLKITKKAKNFRLKYLEQTMQHAVWRKAAEKNGL